MRSPSFFSQIQEICSRPKPYEFYTAPDLWTEPYVAKQMLKWHLDPDAELASRSKEFTDRSQEWIRSHFGLKEGVSVCDFGCGPGIYTTAFAQTGASVTGIDISESSLEHARAVAKSKNLQIKYVCQNYLDFQGDAEFDLITMIFCDFCVLSPEQRSKLLKIFHRSLCEKGRVLLDVCSMKAFGDKQEGHSYEYSESNGFWSEGPVYAFQNSFKYPEETVILDKWNVFEASRTRTLYNWLQCYSASSIAAEFEAAGFSIEGQYANVAGDAVSEDSPTIAVVAAKA